MKGKITIIMLGLVVLCMGGVAQARPPTPPSELQHDELATQHDMIKTDTSDTLTALQVPYGLRGCCALGGGKEKISPTWVQATLSSWLLTVRCK